MKLLTTILLLLPFALTGPVEPVRRYVVEENNPEFKRYIYVENKNGQFEEIDLLAVDPEEVQFKVVQSDVEYDLYTRKSQDYPDVVTNGNVDQLAKSHFDPKKITVFVAHGWNNNRNSAVNTHIRQTIFTHHDVNLFIVDWSGPANKFYLTAKNSVVPVGEYVGDFITKIQNAYGLDGSKFVLIGHSLGAHVVGSAGATAQGKLAHIIGLDPAGPLFSLKHPENRLDISDGEFVQIIHTNGNLLGFASSIGDVDYFPNGGMSQPGCGWDLAGTCAHSKAYLYLAEALSRGPVFQGVLCSGYKDFQKGRCADNPKAVMGQLSIPTSNLGDYYLDTNSDQPFGRH
ncbi:phospholipase A1 [Tribolium castaneum]|uniref:Vitellogenin-3-like Protein n=1 Tax=Tribolium castaneum TaxID=7070 RepID=D6W6G9_TRICA|nr:PREDICTED: phospholipase A1 [Tribolium castaneum]EFA11061.1 Vitellogenin-3-like Protein [Tribolium castaneum]|eukprot:XP_970026.1 PREDICTED: phospholipase A1 [Tribolium castaneum]